MHSVTSSSKVRPPLDSWDMADRKEESPSPRGSSMLIPKLNSWKFVNLVKTMGRKLGSKSSRTGNPMEFSGGKSVLILKWIFGNSRDGARRMMLMWQIWIPPRIYIENMWFVWRMGILKRSLTHQHAGGYLQSRGFYWSHWKCLEMKPRNAQNQQSICDPGPENKTSNPVHKFLKWHFVVYFPLGDFFFKRVQQFEEYRAGIYWRDLGQRMFWIHGDGTMRCEWW